VSTQQAAVIDLAVRTKLLGSGRVSRARLAELPTRRAALSRCTPFRTPARLGARRAPWSEGEGVG